MTGAPACPVANPTGPLAVNTAMAVACRSAANARPTTSMPAFHTTV
jgi:hypothetical protein